MKKSTFLFIVVLFVSFVACKDAKREREQMLQNIKNTEKEILADSLDFLSFKNAGKVIALYDEFAEKYPEDTLTPMFLFRKGEITMNTNQHDLSLKTFDLVIEKYPNFYELDRVYFMRAFLLENYINDIEKAKEAYNTFMQKFPDNELFEDAKISLENIGKTPEELIMEFESKHKD